MKMRSIPSAVALCALFSATALRAQTTKGTGPEISERGPHHRIVQSVGEEIDELGTSILVTNSYVELATGMHYWEDEQWKESKAEFEIVAGGVVARSGQHKVIIAGNINAGGSVDMLLPDGRPLRSNPMGLSYYDSASGKNVLLAEVKDCDGALVAPNVLLFEDAFDTLKAALRFTYTREGFEQDVILYENPGAPELYGLNPATTTLEMYTEFHEAPPVAKRMTRTASGHEDETLIFGETVMGPGKAYFLGQELDAVDVSKSWQTLEGGRQFLIEAVPHAEVELLLEGLDLRKEGASIREAENRNRTLSRLRSRDKSTKTASVTRGQQRAVKGLVLDYATVNGSLSDYRFEGDTTYFISGNVTLTGTKATFEGGAVLKYTNNAVLTANVPLTWQGSPYRPVILTAADDQSVGEVVGTAPLSGYYAGTALHIDANASSSSVVLQNLRVAHAQKAIAINTRSGHVLSHVQLVNCKQGIVATNAEFSLRNALFHNVLTNFSGTTSTGRVEHITANTATWLNNSIGANLFLTNSLLVAVTNFGSYSSTSTYTVATTNGVFQAAGQAAHYLAAGSPYRNVGTTLLNPTLAGELKKRTTYPPVLLSADFTANTTLAPQAARDTDTPDVGYLYDPIDYLWSTLNLTNCTLTLTNGVAIAHYGGKGTTLRTGAKLVSQGTPTTLNRIVRYQAVQEQPVLWGAVPTQGLFFDLAANSTQFTLNFTEMTALADTTTRRSLGANLSAYSLTLSLANSQFRGIYNDLIDGSSVPRTVIITNNVFDACTLKFTQNDVYYGFTLHLLNNLFWKGTNTFTTTTYSPSWTVKDNLFDSDSLTKSGSPTFTVSNNGYRSGLTSLGGSNNKTGLVPDYQTGPLGNFYYPTTGSSTSLTNLFDTGSRLASAAGLYHFTTPTTQAKEATSTVDIGFHYVALDGTGYPVDTDGDGLPDYAEDRDGDGTADAGESNWQSSENGTTGVPGLTVFNILE